jgi:hypothetical protein
LTQKFLYFGSHFGFKMATIANRNGRNMVQHVSLPVNIHFHWNLFIFEVLTIFLIFILVVETKKGEFKKVLDSFHQTSWNFVRISTIVCAKFWGLNKIQNGGCCHGNQGASNLLWSFLCFSIFYHFGRFHGNGGHFQNSEKVCTSTHNA